MGARKFHFLSIDALPWSMLRQFLGRGELPNFQRLEKLGASAQGMVAPGPDATTPAAHAALLCGCDALEHGIYSYEEPAIENGVVHPWKKRSGFDAMRLKAEPLWVKFLQAKRKTALIHFPLSTPIQALTASKKFGADFSEHLFAIESFSQRLTPEIVRKDVNSDDTFKLKLSDGSKVQLPKRAPKNVEPAIFKEKKGGLWRIRFQAEHAGEPDLHFLTPFSGISSNRDDLVNDYLDQVGPFAASATTYSYGTDKLGNRIYKGGNGNAEKRMAQGMELLGNHFYKTVEFALEKISPEAGFYYFNGVNLCLHLWLAYLNPTSPAYSKKICDALWPIVCSVFQWADKIVGLLLDSLRADDLLTVVSDHGMAPIETTFYPNQVLADAGLTVWDAEERSAGAFPEPRNI